MILSFGGALRVDWQEQKAKVASSKSLNFDNEELGNHLFFCFVENDPVGGRKSNTMGRERTPGSLCYVWRK